MCSETSLPRLTDPDTVSVVRCSKPPTVLAHDYSALRCGGVFLEFRRSPDHFDSVSSLPQISSKGVTNSGTNNHSSTFTRRMCPNLFTFAKCSASPLGSAGITLCRMYVCTIGNSRLNGQERQAMNKGQPLRAALWYVSGHLVQYGRAGDQFVSFSGVCPPLPRPIPSCHDIRSGAPFHVEAGDRSLNVDARFGHGHTIPYFARKGTE